jgi:hypothetical protein
VLRSSSRTIQLFAGLFWFFAIFSGIIFDNMVERSVLSGTGLLKIGARNVMEWSVKTKTSRRANIA